MSLLKRLEERIEKTIDKVMGKTRGVAEPMEVVRSIVREVERHIAPLGQGRHVFPYSVIEVQLYAGNEERHSLYQSVLIDDQEVAHAIHKNLQPPKCETPKALDVRVAIVGPEPPDWASTGFKIDYKPREARSSKSKPKAVLHVLAGEANAQEYNLTREITRIGRMVDVYGEDGLPVRHNDLAFFDDQNKINQSVSRKQAHIRFKKELGEYWLYDDTGLFGTVVIRSNGSRIEVSSNPGLKLAAGDKIYLGQACVEFRMNKR
ncbi:MAG TPA: FHA domain-containing protein [Blastocatellia bacterium]|nr:FHA domain-containing protein [Blastocatellia bacterium]